MQNAQFKLHFNPRLITTAILVGILFLTGIGVTGCFGHENRGHLYFEATLDGKPWEGPIEYKVEQIGVITTAFNNVPSLVDELGNNQTILYYQGHAVNVSDIECSHFSDTITYISGGPQYADFKIMTILKWNYNEFGDYHYWGGTEVSRVEGNWGRILVQNEGVDKGTVSASHYRYKIIFQFTSKQAVQVNATLDGAPWSGKINYALEGAARVPGTEAPYRFMDLKADDYAVKYQSGGPLGAKLQDINPPSVSHTANESKVETVTLNFVSSKETVDMEVSATIDGQPWSGSVSYQVEGFQGTAGTSVPKTYQVLPEKYSLKYLSGGPQGATLTGITPTDAQNIQSQGTKFTLNFKSNTKINLQATLNGQPWSGDVVYSILGYEHFYGYASPQSFTVNFPGDYTAAYYGGGPKNYVLSRISSSATQSVPQNSEVTFRLEFVTGGKITVNGTLAGADWSGACSYSLRGPVTLSGTTLPQTFTGVPAGQYTLSYSFGGPGNNPFAGITLSKLASISPSDTQSITVPAGETSFKMNFTPLGSIVVNASFNNSPWSGPCQFKISGPVSLSGDSVPQTFDNVPLGDYTINYVSGTPDSRARCTVVQLAQKLATAGDTVGFKLVFWVPEPRVVTVPTSADLSLTATADTYTPSGAGYVWYTIAVNNSGPSTATGVKIRFLVGAGGYASDIPSQGSYNNTTGIWATGTLASGASANLKVQFGLGGAPSGTVIAYTAEVTASDQADPDSTPNNGNAAEDDQASVSVTAS